MQMRYSTFCSNFIRIGDIICARYKKLFTTAISEFIA